MVFGSIADLFFQWEYLGLFDYVLPFLLVFALVYGILAKTRFMGDNRAVYIIIAVALGLMSLRYQYFFSAFISELFPRLGIGLSVMLAVLILVGLFIAHDESRYWGYGLAALGALIFIVIIYQSFNNLGWFGGYDSDVVGFFVLGILIVGVIIAVAVSGKESSSDRTKGKAIYVGWPDKEHR